MDCETVQKQLRQLDPGEEPSASLRDLCHSCVECARVWQQTVGLDEALRRSPVTVRGADKLADAVVAGLPGSPVHHGKARPLQFPMMAAGIFAAAAAVVLAIGLSMTSSQEQVVVEEAGHLAQGESTEVPTLSPEEVREVLMWLRAPTNDDVREVLAMSNPLTAEVDELQADGRAVGAFLTGSLRSR